MAVAIPRYTELMNHGNALIANFRQQGKSLHQLALREKEVAVRIQSLIDNFDLKDIVQKAPSTIAILKEAQESYRNIKESVNRMDDKGKELSAVIQQIFQHQQQGESESRNIQREIARAVEIMAANDKQIHETKSNLTRMQGELAQLQSAIIESRRKVRRREDRNQWLKTLAVASIVGMVAIPQLNKSAREAHQEELHMSRMYAKTQINLARLEASQPKNYVNKARLEYEQARRQLDIKVIGSILNRLRSIQEDTIKYRQYLLSLSDALTELNSCIQRLERNVDQIAQVQAAELVPDSPMANMLRESHSGLNETWTIAKGQPAIQITLRLCCPDYEFGTLSTIKSANFH